MKRFAIVLTLVLLLTVMLVSPVLAAPGGMPGAHGVDGRTFGAVVSCAARTNPLGLAGHVRGGPAPCCP
jgi:hypothetical protein